MRCATHLRVAYDVYGVHVLLGVGIYDAVRCLCMYVHTASVVKGHDWIWGDCVQQWYEFTTTEGAAWGSMYINISITVKGAECLDYNSWEVLLSVD